METTQMPINGLMNKELYNGKLLSHEKGGYSAICNNMAGPWAYYTKRDKSEKDKYYMIALICTI